MSTVSDDIRDAIGEVFDTLRGDVFFASTDTLKLLGASETINAFTELYTVPSGWFVEYGDLRQSATVSISDTNATLTTKLTAATHFKVNDDVYAIKPADTLPPKGPSIMWTLQGERLTNEGSYTELW